MICKITPLDTLFFRGGQSFNAGETGPLEVTGQFPPPPPTVVGAMRAALARANGWDGKSNWSANPVLEGVLGDGDHLGKLSFQGPYLLKNGEIVYPVPLHILGRLSPANGDGEQQISFTCVSPGPKRLTDIGEVQLPEKVSNEPGFKTLEGYWLTKAGMASVLAGGVPDPGEVLEQATLWQTENRVGIQRDLKSKTTKDNALYQTAHVRLAKDIALAISIDGLPDGWKPQSPAPLGGESRQAWIDGIETLSFPKMPELEPVNGKTRYTATLITPAKLLTWLQSR
jgi:CRISPR-associated protein Cmr3